MTIADGSGFERKRPRLGRPWRRTVQYVLAQDRYLCQIRYEGTWRGVDGRTLSCTVVATTADHIVPRSQGGSDRESNLRASCENCNRHRAALPNPVTDEKRQTRKWT